MLLDGTRMRGRRSGSGAMVILVAVSATLAFTGCSGIEAPKTPATQSPFSSSSNDPGAAEGASDSPTAQPRPELLPSGTAVENLPFFDYTVASVLTTNPEAGSKAIVDALAAAGFEKKAMEVTRDETTVGLAADTIQFSVRWDDKQCLVGQAGPKQTKSGHKTMVADALGSDQCLVGASRLIDW